MALAGDRHSYKEVRLQQLRSFCETARLGSLGAAARSLGLSQPTVWEHVHALERELAAQLIESHHRGCRLTAAGRLLVDLATPIVAGLETLAGTFREQFSAVESRLTVAAPQRVLAEDLFEVVEALRDRYPRMRLRLLERVSGQVSATVESGEADLGVSTDREPRSPRLQFEPAYELSTLLVMSKSHPLARKKTVTPADLKGYPLVNGPEGFTRSEVAAKLQECGAFEAERHVEAMTTAVVPATWSWARASGWCWAGRGPPRNARCTNARWTSTSTGPASASSGGRESSTRPSPAPSRTRSRNCSALGWWPQRANSLRRMPGYGYVPRE